MSSTSRCKDHSRAREANKAKAEEVRVSRGRLAKDALDIGQAPTHDVAKEGAEIVWQATAAGQDVCCRCRAGDLGCSCHQRYYSYQLYT